MTCEHLYLLEKELIRKNVKITFRGKAWSENCREWVYFDCVFSNLQNTIERLKLDPQHLRIHEHLGTHSGQEYGLVCNICKDGIMGHHPKSLAIMKKKVMTIR